MTWFPPTALFSTFSFIGFLLAIIPLPWHVQSWNVGTCMFMLWASLGCLIFFINSVVWSDNVINWAPVWCDISARYIIGGIVGLPGSALCVVRRLYLMTTLQRMSVGKKEKIREIMVDVSIGIGIPCILMSWQYVVQQHRFSIFEQIGCYPSTVNTLATYFLLITWPFVISLIGLIYAVLTFRRAFLLRGELKKILQPDLYITPGCYWHLMAVCSVEICFSISMSLYNIIANAVDGLVPYVSWASGIRGSGLLEITGWIYVLCAFLVFAFFGWGQEARKSYQRAFWLVYGYFRSLILAIACGTLSKRNIRQSRCERTLPIDDVDRRSGSAHLPMPIQARVKRNSFSPPLPVLAAPRSASLQSNPRLSVGEGTSANPSGFSALNNFASDTHFPMGSLPAGPKPLLARGRGSWISVYDDIPL